MDMLLRYITHALLDGYTSVPHLQVSLDTSSSSSNDGNKKNDSESSEETKQNLIKSLLYLKDRIGVPRDLSYPAARQFRAYLNWVAEQL